MHSNSTRHCVRVVPQENKSSTRIRWDSHDTLHSHLSLRQEDILSPVVSLVRAKQHAVRWLLIVGHDENRPIVAKLPQMSVLVHFLPLEATIPGQESVGFLVRRQALANVSDGHDEPRDGRSRVRGASIVALGVAMYLQRTFLRKTNEPTSEERVLIVVRTVDEHSYGALSESTDGGTNGFQEPPVYTSETE